AETVEQWAEETGSPAETVEQWAETAGPQAETVGQSAEAAGSQMETGCYLLEIESECAGAVSDTTRCHYSLWHQEEKVHDLGWGERFRREDGGFCFGRKILLQGLEEWDLEHPVCYRLRVELYEGGEKLSGPEPVDVQEITLGFRRMEFTADRGFFLNGRSVKVHGVCEHHDLGCLGAAFHREAMRRKLQILKEMGVNALRTSHNMPAQEVMELADEMGILVLAEAFDMWERCKTPYDYGRFFKEWAERDVRSWIRRDRNHPSLFLWSIGNEIYDTHADAHGQEITRRLVDYVRAHDSKGNARITIGSNFMPWEGAQNCADIVKVAGYNYGEKYYAEHHREHPDWIIYGSETASVVQSRGVYRFPLRQSVLADEDWQCSALGNSSTSWGARSVEACIADDRDAEFAFGQFLWTGFDYIGEPTPYHTKNSYFGYVDTAGFPKDAYYLFQAEWTGAADHPMVHLYPYWDWNPGQIIDVRSCTNGESVELFVNGRSQGRQKIDHAHGRQLQGDWQVPYEPGEITAVAYDGEGREIARKSRHSFGEAVRLVLEADRHGIAGDGEALCFITVSAVDREGYPVENAMNYVRLSLEGPGRLLGLDNGDSTDYDPYKGCVRKLFNGKLLAVVAGIPGDLAGDSAPMCAAGDTDTPECPEGNATEARGAVSHTNMLECPAGNATGARGTASDTNVLECPAGNATGARGAASDTNVLECPAGDATGARGAASDTNMLECPAGDATGARGAVSHINTSECPEGTTDLPENCVRIIAEGRGLEPACLEIRVKPASLRPGGCAGEDVSRTDRTLPDIVPVRKVELLAPEGGILDPARPSVLLEARICPEDATDRRLSWKVVNQNGIPVSHARVEVLEDCRARVTALGDGTFYVRCQSGQNPARVISQLELTARGLGQAFLNPYSFLCAGLFSETVGEVTNGNEKGIATARDGVSGVVYRDLDFGEYGSDEITMPVFALSDALHHIEIWQGVPEAEGSRLLLNAPYQKPSRWNVYQEETWKLPFRLRGLTTIAFLLRGSKVHIKGFSFTYFEKAYEKLWGAECSRVYGDSFRMEDRAIAGIGNNVTVLYDDMDFGEEGTGSVTLWGRSPLPGNTIHIHFTPAHGETQTRVLEVAGTAAYEPQTFRLEPLTGKGTVELIFLPGSNFDLEAIQFEK
ncbi:MAG: DUF4982 domain-containing protein, partial [Lachnospiraceae bacterium]|nr:DUF4982 domain-containing protein [Lachnospiraceae bacterium]